MERATGPSLIQEGQVERSRQGVRRPRGELGCKSFRSEEVLAGTIGIVENPIFRKGLPELPHEAEIISPSNRVKDSPDLQEGRLNLSISIPICRGLDALEARNRPMASLAGLDPRPPGMTSF